MTAKTWNGLTGAFASSGNWLPQAAPASGDTAVITAGTVTAVGVLPSLLTILLGPLNDLNPTLVLSDSTLVPSSRLDIRGPATLRLRGNVTNQGTISASGTGPVSVQIGGMQEGIAASFINTGSLVVSAAAFQITSGSSAFGGQLENDGVILVRGPGGAAQLVEISSDIIGNGTVVLGRSVTFEAAGAVSAGQKFVFEHGGSGATTLRMDAGKQFNGVITGFGAGDTIQVISSRWDAAAYVSTNVESGVLTLSLGGTVVKATVLKGSYMTSSFELRESIPFGGSQASTTITINDPLFDPAYYLRSNPDVAAAGLDAYQHFMTVGWRQERDPSLMFSDSKYLAANPDVKAAALNPLYHYETYGRAEGRMAFPAGDVATADVLIDPGYYASQLGASLFPAGVAGQQQAAWSYDTTGWQQRFNPNALFDSSYYLTQNPDVRAAGVDPLKHYEYYGWREGRDPSLLFSSGKYLAANPDVTAAALNPLMHYIEYGRNEGRNAFLPESTTAAVDWLVDPTFYDKQLGATLVPAGTAGQRQASASYDAQGWRLGLSPNAFFDTRYYLSQEPVARLPA